MKKILKNLNKAFENRVRLGIMSALVVNDYVNFNTLKELLGVTDGNLASHMKYLEKKGYVEVRKEFVNRKPMTKYIASSEGKEALIKHIKAIEELLK